MPIHPIAVVEIMRARRHSHPDHNLTNGPGKLCQALGLTGAHYAHDLCGAELFLAEGARGRIGRSPRINIDYAGAWVKRPWRFFECGNRYISVAPR